MTCSICKFKFLLQWCADDEVLQAFLHTCCCLLSQYEYVTLTHAPTTLVLWPFFLGINPWRSNEPLKKSKLYAHTHTLIFALGFKKSRKINSVWVPFMLSNYLEIQAKKKFKPDFLLCSKELDDSQHTVHHRREGWKWCLGTFSKREREREKVMPRFLQNASFW